MNTHHHPQMNLERRKSGNERHRGRALLLVFLFLLSCFPDWTKAAQIEIKDIPNAGSAAGNAKIWLQLTGGGAGSDRSITIDNLFKVRTLDDPIVTGDFDLSDVSTITVGDGANKITLNATSLGTGASWIGTQVGGTLGLKSIVAGSNVTVSTSATAITISASGSGSQTPWAQAIDASGYNLSGAGTVAATLFSGSGASLTSLPSAQLTGNIAAARLNNALPFIITQATGDGTTDDTTQLQAELTAMEVAGGGMLMLRANATYRVTAPLIVDVTGKYSIIGAGRSTVIKADGDYGDVIRMVPGTLPTTWATALWHRIEGIHFTSTGTRTSGYLFRSQRTHDAIIRDVTTGLPARSGGETPKFYHGIKLEDQDQCVVENCEIGALGDALTLTGILTAGEASAPGPFTMNGMVRSVWLRSNHAAGSRGVYLNGVGGVHLIDVIAENTHDAFVLDNTREADFWMCSSDDVTGKGYHVIQAERVSFLQCWNSGAQEEGMLIEDCDNVRINGFYTDDNDNAEGLKIVTAGLVNLGLSSIGRQLSDYTPALNIADTVTTLIATGNAWKDNSVIDVSGFTDNGTNIGTLAGGGQPEITTFTGFNPQTLAAGGYFQITVTGGATHTFWFQKGGAGSAPGGQPNPHLVGDFVAPAGAWDGDSVSYTEGDVVTNGPTAYICTADHTSGSDDEEPGVGANWENYWQDYGVTMRAAAKSSIDLELADETNTTINGSGYLVVTDTANGTRTDVVTSSSPASGITASVTQQGSN